MRLFRRNEDGYVLIFAILVLPVFFGFALIILDIGRGNNAHSDLSTAADALALAGARELDGRDDAITRAKVAMGYLNNTVGMLAYTGPGIKIELVYQDVNDNEYTVHFLSDIPDLDTTPITAAYISANTAATGQDAKFVYVSAQSQDLETFWTNPVTMLRQTVPIAARAVATNPGPVACNVMPIFICNPFEGSGNSNFDDRFANGELYGRLFEMHFSESSSPGPGNFGFLRTALGSGASVLREALAIGDAKTCYEQSGVDTKPGQNVGPVEQAINTHFGLYAGFYTSRRNEVKYRPAFNVRMGQKQQGQSCREYNEEESNFDAMALPQGTTMVSIPGGMMSDGPDWDIDLYWDINHGFHATPPLPPYTPPSAPTGDIRNYFSSHPSGFTPGTVAPSRYDTYIYEMSSDVLMSDSAPNGEVGLPQCTNLDLDDYTSPEYRDRRVIFAAVLNCVEQDLQGAETDVPAISFVKMFMTKPAIVSGSTKYLSLEIVDKTGLGGLGTLSNLFREEAVLKR